MFKTITNNYYIHNEWGAVIQLPFLFIKKPSQLDFPWDRANQLTLRTQRFNDQWLPGQKNTDVESFGDSFATASCRDRTANDKFTRVQN